MSVFYTISTRFFFSRHFFFIYLLQCLLLLFILFIQLHLQFKFVQVATYCSLTGIRERLDQGVKSNQQVH